MRQCDGAAAGAATAAQCELAGEVLRAFGSLRVPAIGWSMLPTIRPGDILFVEPIAPDQVRAGDVVVIGRGGRLVGHRVVSLYGGPADQWWITQGDALALPDQPVRKNELLGRVAYLIREGRLVPVPAELSLSERCIAKILRRSVLAARSFVYLHRGVQYLKPQTAKM